jgi:hypothetical protein
VNDPLAARIMNDARVAKQKETEEPHMENLTAAAGKGTLDDEIQNATEEALKSTSGPKPHRAPRLPYK